jgi:hypothetical protein
MTSIEILSIERRASQLRAQEIQRLQGVIGQRLALYAKLLGGRLLALLKTLGQSLRPRFSGHSQHHRHC